MVTRLALFLGQVAGIPSGPGPGPSGAPTNATVSEYDAPNNKWRVGWTVGDSSAYTRVYETTLGGAFNTASLRATENPGVTFNDTGISTSTDRRFWITHYRNGQESAAIFVDASSGGGGL